MKNCLTPKNPKMCDPILVTLLKMWPRYSQSRRENATPSSGTTPLASYKAVPPPPPGLWVNLGFWETAHYPSPKLTLTLTSYLGQNDGLGKGQVGSLPET